MATRTRTATRTAVRTADPLTLQRDFNHLGVAELLRARELNHLDLMRRANVVATAVGLYLIRSTDPWPPEKPPARRGKRTLENSEVRPYSWPCVLVFVQDWEQDTDLDNEDRIPRALYLEDGKTVPVCVVEAPKQPVPARIDERDVLFPTTAIGGGFPVLSFTQGREHLASLGCLVTDGHTTYALTNRHVAGDPDEVLSTRVAGEAVPIGRSAAKQLSRMRFPEVYEGWPGKSAFTNLDVGLIRVDDLSRWTAQVYGLGPLGPIADLGVDNLTLRLIGEPVVGHGCVSGVMRGAIQALFYRYQALGGFEYISDFLIGPRKDGPEFGTHPGDSGTLWALERKGERPRPIALQWGGHVFTDSTGRPQYSCALATCLSTACNLLGVEVVTDWNVSGTEYWGEVGHYTVGAMACSLKIDKLPKLQRLLRHNVERVGFSDADLAKPERVLKNKAGYKYVPLADVADDVWRITRPSDENNHFADMDVKAKSGTYKGKSLLQLCKNAKNVDPDVWVEFYKGVPGTNPGALPFRVWQIYDAMVASLQKDDPDVVEFFTAAGCLAHYVGDACQPLHISELHHGYPPLKKGTVPYQVHAVYETQMLNVPAHAQALVKGLRAKINAHAAVKPTFAGGRGAAQRVVRLMMETFDRLPPHEIVDAYNEETSPAARIDRLWNDFRVRTIECMLAGCVCLADIWASAWREGEGERVPAAALGEIEWEDLATLYRDKDFLPSWGLAHLAKVLTGAQA
jgi:hypothetical protein